MKKPLVAVLGCGPSGLIAAHTLEWHRVPFVIFSKVQKSMLGGAQFSHIEIPGLGEADVTLTYRVRGDAEVYQRKVYGDNQVPFVSFENVKDGMQVPAWNLRGMYDQLWDKYADRVVEVNLDSLRVLQISSGFDLTFSSVPLPLICYGTRKDPHGFRQQTVRIWNGLYEDDVPDNTIVYDGTAEHQYYRLSNIFGTGGTEWGAAAPLPALSDIKTVNKPIGTNCNCHPNVTRIGRFGTWTKGILTNHAYKTVLDSLTEWGVEI